MYVSFIFSSSPRVWRAAKKKKKKEENIELEKVDKRRKICCYQKDVEE